VKLLTVWQSIRQKTDPRIRLIVIALLVGTGFWFLDAVLSSQYYYPDSFTELLFYEVPIHHLYSRIIVLIVLLIYGFSLGQHLYRAESKEREYKMLLNTTKDAVMIHGMDGRFLEVNTAATDQLGYTRDQLLNMRIMDINPIEDVEFIRQRMQRIIRQGSEHFETLLRTRENDVLDVEITTTYIPGKEEKFIAFVQDLTEKKSKTRQLRESESRLKGVVHSIRDVIYTLDLEHRHTGVYGNWFEDAGMSKDDFLGKTPREIFGPDEAALHEDAVNRALHKEHVVYEWSIPGENGSLYYQTSLTPLLDNNEVVGVIGVGRNITDRKKAEKALIRSEKKFREIFQNVNDAIYLHGLDSDGTPSQFISVNETACKMLGYTQDELLNMSPMDINSDDLLKNASQTIENLLAQGNIQFEGHHKHKNGSLIPVEINTDLFELEGEQLALSVARDISERKQAEIELHKSNERLHLAVKASGIGFWDWDLQSDQIIINKESAHILGYTQEELSPITIQTWNRLTHPQDIERAKQHMHKYLAGIAEYYECEIRMRHKNGDWIWVRERGKVVEWSQDEEAIRMTGTHSDITEAKRRDRQKDERLQRMQEVLDPIDLGVLMVNQHEKITYLNRTAASYFHVDPENIINKPVNEVFAQQDWESLYKIVHMEWEKSESPESVKISASSIEGMDNNEHMILEIFPLDYDGENYGFLIKFDQPDSVSFQSMLKLSAENKEIITLCSNCHKVQGGPDHWVSIETYIHEFWEMLISHGLCPDCLNEMVHSGVHKQPRKEKG